MTGFVRVEDSRHIVRIDVPVEHVRQVYEIVMSCRGTIGYQRTFVLDDVVFDTMLVDLGSLPAIIEDLGIGAVGCAATEEEIQQIDPKDPRREKAVWPWKDQ